MAFSLFRTLVLSVLVFALSAQVSAAVKTENYIPAGVPAVLSVNVDALLTKSDVRNMPFFTAMLAGMTDDELTNVAANPALAGLDIKAPVQVFLMNIDLNSFLKSDSRSRKSGSPVVVGGVISLLSGDKFKAWIKKVSDGEAEFKKGKGYEYFVEDEVCVAWNQGVLAFAVADGMQEKDLLKQVETIFAAAGGKNLTSDRFFKSFVARPADLGVWLDFDYFTKAIAQSSMSDKDLLAALEELKGTYMGMRLNFLTGQVTLDMETFTVNKDMMMGKDYFRKADKKLLEQIPGKNLIGLFATAVNMEKYKVTIQKSLDRMKNMDELDEVLKEMGLTTKDLLEAFKGDFVVSVGGLDVKNKSVDIYSAISLANVKTAEKVLYTLNTNEVLSKKQKGGQVYYIPSEADSDMPEVAFFIREGVFYAATPSVMDNILSGRKPSTGLPQDASALINTNHAAGAFYISNLVASMVEGGFDEEEKPVLEMVAAFMPSVEITGNTISENEANSRITVIIADKKQNSLKAIINWAMEVVQKQSQIEAEKRKKYQKDKDDDDGYDSGDDDSDEDYYEEDGSGDDDSGEEDSYEEEEESNDY